MNNDRLDAPIQHAGTGFKSIEAQAQDRSGAFLHKPYSRKRESLVLSIAKGGFLGSKGVKNALLHWEHFNDPDKIEKIGRIFYALRDHLVDENTSKRSFFLSLVYAMASDRKPEHLFLENEDTFLNREEFTKELLLDPATDLKSVLRAVCSYISEITHRVESRSPIRLERTQIVIDFFQELYEKRGYLSEEFLFDLFLIVSNFEAKRRSPFFESKKQKPFFELIEQVAQYDVGVFAEKLFYFFKQNPDQRSVKFAEEVVSYLLKNKRLGSFLPRHLQKLSKRPDCSAGFLTLLEKLSIRDKPASQIRIPRAPLSSRMQNPRATLKSQ